MRLLFCTLPAAGHFFPMVPLAWAMRAAGHDVMVASSGDFQGTVTASGLSFARTVEHLDMRRMIGTDRDGRLQPNPPNEMDKLRRSGRGFARASAAVLAATDSLIRSWQPHVVLCGPVEYAGQVSAAAAGVPFVIHEWGLPVPAALTQTARTEMESELRTLGMRHAMPAAAMTVDMCPPSLRHIDVPGSRTMRFIPYNGESSVPAWVYEPSDGRRVCITFGTLINNYYPGIADSITRLVAELTGGGFEVVLAVGEQLAAQLASVPAVRQAGWVALHAAVSACDVVVHHGGSGTALTAMAAGTLQVVTPYASDQLSNAERIRVAGVGIPLQPRSSPADVHAACVRVLAEQQFASCAAGVRDEIARQPAPAEIVADIESVAAATR